MKHVPLNSRNFKPHTPAAPAKTASYNGIGEGGLMPKPGSATPGKLDKTSHDKFKSMIKSKRGIS